MVWTSTLRQYSPVRCQQWYYLNPNTMAHDDLAGRLESMVGVCSTLAVCEDEENDLPVENGETPLRIRV